MKKTNYVLLILLSNAFLIGALTAFIPKTSLKANSETNDSLLSTPSTSAPKDWTFMVYLDADCNLESAGIDDINEMEQVGSDSNINIIVQIDRIPGYDSSNGDWTGAKRYYISRDYQGSTITSTVVENLGEVNMGSSATLQSFVQWGKSNYVNPPFGSIIHKGKKKGPTAWAKKAMFECSKGKNVVLVYPIDKWVLMILEAIGAKVRNLGDVHWLSIEDGLPGKGTGRHVACFILNPDTIKIRKKLQLDLNG